MKFVFLLNLVEHYEQQKKMNHVIELDQLVFYLNQNPIHLYLIHELIDHTIHHHDLEIYVILLVLLIMLIQ
jgi:hypothetical protein